MLIFDLGLDLDSKKMIGHNWDSSQDWNMIGRLDKKYCIDIKLPTFANNAMVMLENTFVLRKYTSIKE